MQTANGTVTTGKSIQVDLKAKQGWKSKEVELLVIPESQTTDGLLLLGAKGMQKFNTNLDFAGPGKTLRIKITDGRQTHSVPMINCGKLRRLERAVICKLAAVTNERRHTDEAAKEWYDIESQKDEFSNRQHNRRRFFAAAEQQRQQRQDQGTVREGK